MSDSKPIANGGRRHTPVAAAPRSETDESAMRLGQIVARGATFLFLSQIASAIVGLLGSIILVRLLVNPAAYAPITLAITVPGLVMLGDATGVNSSLTRFLSEYKRTHDSNAIWSSFWTGFLVKAATGVVLSGVAYFAAGPISSLIGKTQVLPYFQIAAPLPFVWVTQVNVKSVLLALDAPRGYSVLQVVNEILLSVAPILAVLMGLGAMGALSYMVAANFVYLAIAYGYCVSVVLSVTSKGQRELKVSSTVGRLVNFGAPLGLSNSFGNFSSQLVNLVIARVVSLDIYGLYSVAESASGFISYVVDPIKSMLLPAYSRVASLKDSSLMKSLCIQTTRYKAAIVLPVVLYFVVFAGPFVTTLYGNQYAGSGVLLSLVAASFFSTGLAYDVLTTFLTSSGYTRFIGGVGIVSSVTTMVIAILVVPTLGLTGFLVAAIFSFLPGYVLVVRKAKVALGLAPPVTLVLPLYYAVVLTGVVAGAVLFIPMPSAAAVCVGLVLVPVLYVVGAAAFRGIEPADFDRLRGMMATQSLVPKFIGPFVEALQRVVRYVRRE